MWLATKYGFFSVVCGSKEVPSTGPVNGEFPKGWGVDPDVIMVRARVRDHLERLTKGWKSRFGFEAQIISNKGTDYPYRIILNRREWVEILMYLGSQIDYTNFKSEAEKEFGHGRYSAFLLSTWAEGLEMQRQTQMDANFEAAGIPALRGNPRKYPQRQFKFAEPKPNKGSPEKSPIKSQNAKPRKPEAQAIRISKASGGVMGRVTLTQAARSIAKHKTRKPTSADITEAKRRLRAGEKIPTVLFIYQLAEPKK